MRILFIGCVEFSRNALEEVIRLGGEVVGVCTLERSAFNADHHDLKDVCDRHGIACVYSPEINSEASLRWIAEKKPDVIFCFGWSKLLGERLLSLPPMGVIGFHPAALPANRGRHPLIWALVLGLTETASSFFFMDQGADSGDILSQVPISIDSEDDAGCLYAKVSAAALGQIGAFLPQLTSGHYPRLKQDESQASSWRKRGRADGIIDWRMSARGLHNLVRGLSKPYVGAQFAWNGTDYTVWKTEIVTSLPANMEPGRVALVDQRGPVVKCGEEGLRIIACEPALLPAVGDYL